MNGLIIGGVAYIEVLPNIIKMATSSPTKNRIKSHIINISYYKRRTKMRHKKIHPVKSSKVGVKLFNSVKLCTALLLGLWLTGLQAQTMYVNESSGTQTAYTLSNIQKMSFSSGNLTVTKTDNSSGVYALSELRYLNFSDISTDLQEDLSVQSQLLKVYPNPVGDILNIDLTRMSEAEGTLSILNFEGKTMITRQVSNEGVLSLDISRLPTGIYLCRYSNATEIKTVKIDKQ
jgi:hypothetical protein